MGARVHPCNPVSPAPRCRAVPRPRPSIHPRHLPSLPCPALHSSSPRPQPGLAEKYAGSEVKTRMRSAPFVQIPLGVTEDRLVGTVDIEASMKVGWGPGAGQGGRTGGQGLAFRESSLGKVAGVVWGGGPGSGVVSSRGEETYCTGSSEHGACWGQRGGSGGAWEKRGRRRFVGLERDVK